MGNNTSSQIKSAHLSAMDTMNSQAQYAKSNVNHDTFNEWRNSFSEYFQAAFTPSHPLTIECLSHEVMSMKVGFVEHMLHQGMNVNEPMNARGNTVLDAFLVAHQDNLKQVASLRCSSKEKTAIFMEIEERAFAMMDVLRQHGAKTSAPASDARARPAYVA